MALCAIGSVSTGAKVRQHQLVATVIMITPKQGVCTDEIWPDTLQVDIDPVTHKALRASLPLCKNCGKVRRSLMVWCWAK